MKIVRPWAAQGDCYEVMVPDEDDRAAVREQAPPVDAEAVQRYLQARYGGLTAALTRCPGCGVSDDVPMDSAPLPENDEEARSYCVTCGRRRD